MQKRLTLTAFALVSVGVCAAQPAGQPQTDTNKAVVLKPQFTDASIRIAMPDAYSAAYPEIHEGLIAVASGNGMGTSSTVSSPGCEGFEGSVTPRAK